MSFLGRLLGRGHGVPFGTFTWPLNRVTNAPSMTQQYDFQAGIPAQGNMAGQGVAFSGFSGAAGSGRSAASVVIKNGKYVLEVDSIQP